MNISNLPNKTNRTVRQVVTRADATLVFLTSAKVGNICEESASYARSIAYTMKLI